MGPTLLDTHINIEEYPKKWAARWAFSDYNYLSSVSAMLSHLKWPPLALRRKQFRLNLFYQTVYGLTGLSLLEYYLPNSQFTRHHHPLWLIIPSSNTITAYKTFS